MSLSRRKLTNGEHWVVDFRLDVQVGIELEHPRLVPEYIERIKKITAGLYLKSIGDEVIQTSKCEEAIKLPTFATLEESCEWVGQNMIPLSKSMGTIAANDRFVTLSLNHLAADGVYCVNFLRELQDKNYNPKDIRLLPIASDSLFPKQISKVDLNYEYFNKNKITRVQSKCKLPKTDFNTFAKGVIFKEPIQKFQAYSPKDNKLHGFTDAIWTGLMLSMNAFEGKLGPTGCSTCVDMRPYINAGPKNLNLISIIFNEVPVSRNQTVKELGQLMREDFNFRCKRGDLYAYMNPNTPYLDFPHYGSIAEISQLPPARIRKPINDAWIQITMRDLQNETLSLLGHSIINEDKNTNVYASRLRYVPSQLTDKDALKISEGIHHFLTSIPPDTTVGQAFDELMEFQKGI